MRNFLVITFLSFVFFMPNHFGFGGQPPSPPSFLNAQMSDMIHQPPIFLTDTSNVSFIFQYSYVTPTSIDANMDIDGTSSFTNSERNLHWDIPQNNFTLGIDLKTWSNLYLFSVLKITGDGEISGADFGFSARIITEDTHSLRFDLGLSYINSTLNSKFVKITSSDTIYRNYTDKTNFNPFTSLTFYTKNPDYTINILFHISYSFQNIFSFNNGWSRDVSSDYSLFTLMPGILYNPDPNIILLVGARYFIFNGLEDVSKKFIISPALQFSYRL